jgi:hypothetical protein
VLAESGAKRYFRLVFAEVRALEERMLAFTSVSDSSGAVIAVEGLPLDGDMVYLRCSFGGLFGDVEFRRRGISAGTDNYSIKLSEPLGAFLDDNFIGSNQQATLFWEYSYF